MPFGLDLRQSRLFRETLPALEDDARDWLGDRGGDAASIWSDLRTAFDRSDLARLFEGDPFRSEPAPPPAEPRFLDGAWLDLVLERGGLTDPGGTPEIRNLDDLAALAETFPPELAGPDATGEVPTGSAAFAREDLALAATLAAAARVVDALGPEAAVLETRGEPFTIGTRYEDPASGFSAVRLSPFGDGPEVFSVDGLEVGSRPDEVAAVTLGRLQVESEVFRAMVEDAARLGAAGEEVLFTGASLGGAVAQVAAHETAEALLAAGVSAAPGETPVGLVTVDPLGGVDAALAINGGMLDPAALALIEALNLRTDNDIVSRISSHIGATLTLPARDPQGNIVEVPPSEAHVNVRSLLLNLSRPDYFDDAVLGAPPEISGFAAASNATAEEVIALWQAAGEPDTEQRALQITGTASLDPTRTLWRLDADDDGAVDLAVQLASPLDPARDDLVLG